MRMTSSEGRFSSESTEFKIVAGSVIDITSFERLPSKESLVMRFFLAMNPHTMMKNSMSIWVNVCWNTSIARMRLLPFILVQDNQTTSEHVQASATRKREHTPLSLPRKNAAPIFTNP